MLANVWFQWKRRLKNIFFFHNFVKFVFTLLCFVSLIYITDTFVFNMMCTFFKKTKREGLQNNCSMGTLKTATNANQTSSRSYLMSYYEFFEALCLSCFFIKKRCWENIIFHFDKYFYKCLVNYVINYFSYLYYVDIQKSLFGDLINRKTADIEGIGRLSKTKQIKNSREFRTNAWICLNNTHVWWPPFIFVRPSLVQKIWKKLSKIQHL